VGTFEAPVINSRFDLWGTSSSPWVECQVQLSFYAQYDGLVVPQTTVIMPEDGWVTMAAHNGNLDYTEAAVTRVLSDGAGNIFFDSSGNVLTDL
jgi:hypothetical protein